MNILTIYKKVSQRTPLEQGKFFDYYNESVQELESLYDDFLYKDGKGFIPAETLDDENNIRDLYCGAVADNITFLAGGDAAYKSEFARKAENAWLKYWNDNAKNRHLKRERW